MSIYDKQRGLFRVVEWDNEKKAGTIVDQYGMKYDVRLSNLAPEADGVLFVGEEVEGIAHDAQTILDILGTSASSMDERSNYSSVGASAGVQGWTPQTGRGLGT